ncbi:MAG: HIT family protein [bacterium]
MCNLCKGDDGFREDLILHETDYCYIMANLFPIGVFSFLIITKRHISSVTETTIEEEIDFMSLIKKVSSCIEKIFNDDYNIFINKGLNAGQTIPHLHCHLVVNSAQDGVKIMRKKLKHEIKEEELEDHKVLLEGINKL